MFKKVLSLSFLFASILCARFATESETTYDVEECKQTYTINEDGSYEVLSEVTYFIKNEMGRDQLAKSASQYREKTEKLEVLEAKTIFNGKEYIVKKEDIEDKELASSTNGFESKRQVIIAYPQAQVGAKLYKKIKFKSNLIITKNHFYTNLFPIDDGWVKHTEVTIDSKIPLKFKVNDPFCLLEFKTEDEKDGYFTKATLTLKKHSTDWVLRDIPGHLSNKKQTYVSLSSLDKWDNILKDLMPHYDEVMNAELPPLYQSIIEKAKEKENDIQKIETVISELANNVQYLGSWMTFNGRYIPRSFCEVEKSRFADCKDFSSGTVAMLRKLGFKAEVIFVSRGENQPDYEGLPAMFCNHAMVKAIGTDGKIYWLDPTNFVSTTFILPDDANRSVIVPIDHEKKLAALEKTAPVEAFHVQKVDHIKVRNDGRLEHDISMRFSETYAMTLGLTGIHLRLSPEVIEDFLYQQFVEGTVKKEDRLGSKIPELKDRVIRPVNFSVQFISDDLVNSNLGKAYFYKSHDGFLSSIVNIRPEENVNDWLLDLSQTKGVYDNKTIIVGKKIRNPESLCFNLETPWFRVTREIIFKDHDSIISEKIEVLTDFIKNEDLKSEEFLKAQRELISTYREFIIELEEEKGTFDCLITTTKKQISSVIEKTKTLLYKEG
ncbi:MAG: DUF3857 domain-containing protein [Proteobacteria bacterium]|nr:DUF3857 domain-containing protein [Pseudomonadota bacterium]